MLKFPEDYFQEERKCNFTVSKTMKHAWAAQLEVLQNMIAVCEKHNIHYYAFWGTLLGAVRHEGYIPWDDDIDIAMKREDYIKFQQVAKELPAEYCFINVHTEEEWPHFCARVTNARTVSTSEKRLLQFHGCPFVVGVDIFPLDYIPRDENAAELQKTLLGIIRDILPLAKLLKENGSAGVDISEAGRQESRETLEAGIAALETCCKISIDRGKPVDNQLLRLYDKICMMYGEEDGEILTSYPEYIKGGGFFLQKEWFGVKQMLFENMHIMVPAGYDHIMTELYGDYMEPVQSGSDHEYPFYREQLQSLHERGIWLDVAE